MTENTSNEEISKDELICPITLELFRDPVKAKDGHVYERHAITRWILQHGTSPLTRQPLQINDLEADERLRNLARARRTSTVSYNSNTDQVTLPPLQRLGRYANSNRIAPDGISSPRRTACLSNKPSVILFMILVCVLIPVSVTIVAVLISRLSFQGLELSYYTGALTTNSSTFNRYNSSSPGQYYYDKINIRISKDGLYEFGSENVIDMVGYLYLNPFNDTNVSLNLLIFNDNSLYNQFYFRYSLQSSSNYVLIATSTSSNITGSFLIKARGPSTVIFN